MWNKWSMLQPRGTTRSSGPKLTKQTAHSLLSLAGGASEASLLYFALDSSNCNCLSCLLRAFLKLVCNLKSTRRIPTGLTRRSIDSRRSCSTMSNSSGAIPAFSAAAYELFLATPSSSFSSAYCSCCSTWSATEASNMIGAIDSL